MYGLLTFHTAYNSLWHYLLRATDAAAVAETGTGIAVTAGTNGQAAEGEGRGSQCLSMDMTIATGESNAA